MLREESQSRLCPPDVLVNLVEIDVFASSGRVLNKDRYEGYPQPSL